MTTRYEVYGNVRVDFKSLPNNLGQLAISSENNWGGTIPDGGSVGLVICSPDNNIAKPPVGVIVSDKNYCAKVKAGYGLKILSENKFYLHKLIFNMQVKIHKPKRYQLPNGGIIDISYEGQTQPAA